MKKKHQDNLVSCGIHLFQYTFAPVNTTNKKEKELKIM